MEENNKVLELRHKYLGEDLVKFLMEDTPEEYVDKRPVKGGRIVRYIYGHYFIRKLNDAFGFLWNFDIIDERLDKDHIVVKGRLSVKVPGRTLIKENPDGSKETVIIESIEVSKTQYGGSEVKKFVNPSGKYKAGDYLDLANDFKAAATDALKKCGTELGIGLDIYGTKDGGDEEVTKTQIDALYMRGEKAGMTQEQTNAWAEEKLSKPVGKASSIEILGLLPALIEMAKNIG